MYAACHNMMWNKRILPLLLSITKEILSRQFIDAKEGQLLLNVQSVMNIVSTYFVSYVSSKITFVQGNMLSTYSTLISHLNQLNMLTGESDIEQYARGLQIWRKPIFNYDKQEVSILWMHFYLIIVFFIISQIVAMSCILHYRPMPQKRFWAMAVEQW